MVNPLIDLSFTWAHSTNLVTMDDLNDDGRSRTHDHGDCDQHVASATSWKSLLSPLNGGVDDDQLEEADSSEACWSLPIETITG
jgi:hypothetical protein